MNVRLFVGNVSYRLGEADLTRLFAEQGIEISNVKIARDKETSRARGFAFIEVDPGDVDQLVKTPPMIDNRPLRIERASQQPDSAPARRPEHHGRDQQDRRQDNEPWREDRRKSHRR